jgi:hypothetical protein
MYPTETEQMTIFEFYPQGTLDLANLLVLPGSEKAREMTAISGRKLSAFSKRSDPVGLLAKMLLDTSHWASTKCLMTWQASATPRNRLIYQLAVSEQITDERGYLLLPTARANKVQAKMSNKLAKRHKGNLEEELSKQYPDQHGKYVNPQFVEWLMGFPTGWTDLKPSEMQSSLSKSIPS